MIDVIFQLADTYILVRVDGVRVTFANTMFGAQMADITGLKLSQAGVVKEFPDLKDNPEWKTIACQRFKDKIASMRSDDERAIYLIEDLKAHGYIPKFKQKSGFRKEVLK